MGFGHKKKKKMQIRTQTLNNLNDFQKLLGDINWLRPYLHLNTGEHKPLFDVLQGDSDPLSPQTLTAEASQALSLVEDAIHKQFSNYHSPHRSLLFLVFPTVFSPAGLFWQTGPLYWTYLSASPSKVLATYPL